MNTYLLGQQGTSVIETLEHVEFCAQIGPLPSLDQ